MVGFLYVVSIYLQYMSITSLSDCPKFVPIYLSMLKWGILSVSNLTEFRLIVILAHAPLVSAEAQPQ
jgi:hypothetical protein